MRIKLAVHVYMDVTTNQLWLVNDEDSSEMKVYRLMGDQREEDEEPFTASEVVSVDDPEDIVAKLHALTHSNEYGVTNTIYQRHRHLLDSIMTVLRDEPNIPLTPYEVNNRLGTPLKARTERELTARVLNFMCEGGRIKRYKQGNRHYLYQVKGPNGHHHTNE